MPENLLLFVNNCTVKTKRGHLNAQTKKNDLSIEKYNFCKTNAEDTFRYCDWPFDNKCSWPFFALLYSSIEWAL
jgi:hypothetical protein